MKDVKEMIDGLKDKILNGGTASRDELLALLAIEPGSEDCEYLGRAAHKIAKASTHDKIRVGISIGVDYAPCKMNCKFCSLGEKWGLVTRSSILLDDVIVRIVEECVAKGYFQFVLRTTEFFPNEKLCDYARQIRLKVKGRYILVANTGEQTPESAKALKDAGFNAVYHTVRFREGEDTGLSVQQRIDSNLNSLGAGLKISLGLDPIGVEHTDEEIVDLLMLYKQFDPVAICTMRRIPVPGTPKGELPALSMERHLQLVAVNRFANPDVIIPMHPASMEAFGYGGNHVSVEFGADPRSDSKDAMRWYPCTPDEMSQKVRDEGYEIGTVDDFIHIMPLD